MSILKLSVLALLYNICSVSFAQDFIVGAKYGYAEGYYKQISSSEKTAFTKINEFGLTFAYSPYYSKLSVESAILIEKTDMADYISIPLGFRITIGKKVRPFFEGGVYYSFLQKDKSEIYEMNNDYGARIGSGIVLAIGRQWRIEAAIFKKFGFAGTLVEKIPVPGNTFKDEKNQISPVDIELALKYRF
jgi:hypothetical protein